MEERVRKEATAAAEEPALEQQWDSDKDQDMDKEAGTVRAAVVDKVGNKEEAADTKEVDNSSSSLRTGLNGSGPRLEAGNKDSQPSRSRRREEEVAREIAARSAGGLVTPQRTAGSRRARTRRERRADGLEDAGVPAAAGRRTTSGTTPGTSKVPGGPGTSSSSNQPRPVRIPATRESRGRRAQADPRSRSRTVLSPRQLRTWKGCWRSSFSGRPVSAQ